MNYNQAKSLIINDRWPFVKLCQAKRTLIGVRNLKDGGIPWDKIDGSVIRNSPGNFHFLCYENAADKNPRIIEFNEETKYSRAFEPTPQAPAISNLSDGISPAMVNKLMELERVKVELIQKITQVEQQERLIKTLNAKIEQLEIELSLEEVETDDTLDDANNIWQDLAQGLAPHIIAAAPGLLDSLISKFKNNGQPLKSDIPSPNQTQTFAGSNPAPNVEYFE